MYDDISETTDYSLYRFGNMRNYPLTIDGENFRLGRHCWCVVIFGDCDTHTLTRTHMTILYHSTMHWQTPTRALQRWLCSYRVISIN